MPDVLTLMSMRRNLFSGFLILFACLFVLQAGSISDSFLINGVYGSCEKADKLNKLSYDLLNSDPDSARQCAFRALRIGCKLKNKDVRAEANKNLGNTFLVCGNIDSAKYYYERSIDNITNKNSQLYAKVINNIGMIYDFQGDFSNAIIYYKKALGIYTNIQDLKGIADCYNNLGVIYYLKGDYKPAIENYYKSIEYEEKLGNEEGICQTFINISNIYIDLEDFQKAEKVLLEAVDLFKKSKNMGDLAAVYINLGTLNKRLGNTEVALRYFRKSLRVAKILDSKSYASQASNNISILYAKTGNYDSTAHYLDLCLKYATEANEKQVLILANKLYGDVNFHRGLTDKALVFYNRAESLARESGSRAELMKILEAKSHAYSEINNYKKALHYYQLYSLQRDTVFDNERMKQVQELNTRYETRKKELEITNLQHKNEVEKLNAKRTKLTGIVISMVLILILVIVIFLYRTDKLKNLRLMAVTEQRLFRAQMNPHFIFNSLSSIQSFVSKNDALKANSYLARFSKLMRSVLYQSRDEYILLSDEIQSLENYLELQNLRLKGGIDYKIEVDEVLDTDELNIIPMLIQPFVENAVEHGILKKESKTGSIHIGFNSENKYITIVIEDNGIGRSMAEKLKPKDHKSAGMEITRQRLRLLNKGMRKKIRLEIVDLEVEDKPLGTRVIIHFPKIFS